MAQLTEESFASGDAPMSLEQALALIAERVCPVPGTETVPLALADGRVLAEEIVAGLDLPPFANSAVDGYAVRFADLHPEGRTRLPLVGRVAAGSAATGISADTAAVRIFTGAPLPAVADTVFMQEDVTEKGSFVDLPGGLARGANVRAAGEDIARGEVAMPAGTLLRPPELALLAALGRDRLLVRRRPRVALFSTGDELTEPGERLSPAGIYDANRAALRALLGRSGAEVIDLGILRDVPDRLSESLAGAAAACDLVMTSGGVSVGEEDHVRAAVERLGSLVLWRIGIKPGRPVAMGSIDGVPFVGLPGNPVAAVVTFAFLGRAVIARLSGATYQPPRSLPVRLGFSHRKKPGRREFIPVLLSPSADGVMAASRQARAGAALLTSLTRSDGLVALTDDLVDVEAGTVVPFFDHDALAG